MTEKYSNWFTFEAGMAIRGRIRRELETGAWERNLEVSVQESKGFFESTYKFTVTGDEERVKRYIRDVQEWLREQFAD